MSEKLLEAALGISSPWYIAGVDFVAEQRTLTIRVDFAVAGDAVLHPVHDTVSKRYRHLNFFQHECVLEVRTPRVKLPDGSVQMVEPGGSGKLAGFTLLFEALVMALCREMPFTCRTRWQPSIRSTRSKATRPNTSPCTRARR